MQEDQLLVMVEGANAFMRIVGQGSLKMGEGFKKWNMQLKGNSGITCIMMDMSQCTVLDSTFMGLMMELALFTHAHASLLVVNANPVHHHLLDEIGVTRFWQYAEFAMDGHDWNVLVTARKGAVALDESMRDIILSAHETLMDLSEANASRFSNVVELLKQSHENP